MVRAVFRLVVLVVERPEGHHVEREWWRHAPRLAGDRTHTQLLRACVEGFGW